jgi:peptidyl-prolyl cis-trans isomerase C
MVLLGVVDMLKKINRTLFLLLLLFAISVEADQVLIEGEGFALTDEELTQRLSLLSLSDRLKVGANQNQLNNFINHQYRVEALSAHARQAGIAELPSVQAQIAAATRRILIVAYTEQQREAIQYPDLLPLARLHYASAKTNYVTDEMVEARHLLLKLDKPDELDEKMIVMEGLKQRIEAGEDFAALAEEYSQDQGTAKQGGLLKPFAHGMMAPEFEQAAFGLSEPGELSEIIQTKFGLHLIKLVATYPPRQKTFEEVKPLLLGEVREEYMRESLNTWRNAIVDPAKAKMNVDGLKSFVETTVSATQSEAVDIRRAIDKKMAAPAEKTP